MKKLKCVIAILLIPLLVLSGCSNNGQKSKKKTGDVTVKWKEEIPDCVGNESKSFAKIGDVNVVKENDTYILTIDFEYTNQSDDAKDFINDSYCKVQPYQDGVELESPGVTSGDKFDYSDAFKGVKKGGTIKTQLAWKLENTKSNIEIDFGLNKHYNPQFTGVLVFTNVKKTHSSTSEKKDEENIIDNDLGEYNACWDGDVPSKIGNDETYAKIVGTPRIKKYSGDKYVLILDFEYTNKSNVANNFINDFCCKITVYQNGVELEYPGETSDTNNTFDYSNAYKRVKNNGTINTQLVWVLENTNDDIELELGRNSNYEIEFNKKIIISK